MIDIPDLKALNKIRRLSYYFRYPLHRHDFHELTIESRLYGHYAAKPLYGRLKADGRVDKSAGLNGDIVALFLSVEAETIHDAQIFIAHTDPARIVRPDGGKNRDEINAVAAQHIRKEILKNHGGADETTNNISRN